MGDLQEEEICEKYVFRSEKYVLVLGLNFRTSIQWKRLLLVCRNKKRGTGSFWNTWSTYVDREFSLACQLKGENLFKLDCCLLCCLLFCLPLLLFHTKESERWLCWYFPGAKKLLLIEHLRAKIEVRLCRIGTETLQITWTWTLTGHTASCKEDKHICLPL